MSRTIVWLALLVLAAAPNATAFAHGSGKGSNPPPAPPRKPTHDDEAALYLQTVAATRFSQSDDAAVASVRKLVGYWQDAAVAASTKQSIPGLVTWYAKRKSPAVALAGINGLAEIGKGPGAENLVHVLEGLIAQKDASPDLTTAAFGGLKTVADPDPAVLGSLLQLLAGKDQQVVAKTVDLFGAYGAAPVPARRRLAEALLSTCERMAAVAAKAADKDAVDRWTVLAPTAVNSLRALTHQQFADLAAARKWWNEHGPDADAWK